MDLFYLLPVIFVSSFVLTMVGLGGGLIFSPLFVLLGFPISTAVSASLFLNGTAALVCGHNLLSQENDRCQDSHPPFDFVHCCSALGGYAHQHHPCPALFRDFGSGDFDSGRAHDFFGKGRGKSIS
jgi:uncharacterized membrane protein YfcA